MTVLSITSGFAAANFSSGGRKSVAPNCDGSEADDGATSLGKAWMSCPDR